VQGHEDVRWLQVAVNYAFLVRVLHGLANRDEQLQPGRGRQAVLVAIARNRDPAHEFHDEEGTSAAGRAGVEHAGNIRVFHQRERLSLHLEPRNHLVGVHADLDDLHGYAPANGLLLLGHPDRAKAALPELLQQLVVSNLRTRRVVDLRLQGKPQGPGRRVAWALAGDFLHGHAGSGSIRVQD